MMNVRVMAKYEIIFLIEINNYFFQNKIKKWGYN